MKRHKPQFHPRSPVQRDRRSKLPLLVISAFALFTAWKLRDTWVDALAPPAAETDAVAPPQTTGGGKAAGDHARGNLTGLISADDYPLEALRKEETGRTTAKLEIDPTGRVSKCEIAASSGSASLDRATCDILSKRARFEPARDSNGKAVGDTYTQTIAWELR